MRFTWVIAIVVLCGCGSESETEPSCESACESVVHVDAKAGIPLDADPVLVSVCTDEGCVEVSVAVPADAVTETTGTDPKLVATIERTPDPFASDLQGVFHFDVTWSSSSKRLAEGDMTGFSVTETDGGNVVSIGHSIQAGEAGECGCSSIELTF
jgi:hypothetical protein